MRFWRLTALFGAAMGLVFAACGDKSENGTQAASSRVLRRTSGQSPQKMPTPTVTAAVNSSTRLSIATVEALPGVVDAVDGQVPVVLDSGVRSGADVFRALALGASAVLLGRPYVYGLGIAGQDGVEEVIRNFLADFDLTMGLAGCRSVAEIGREALTRVD